MAGTLREYNQTMIEVVGHTDSIGSDAVNNRLSKERADSVAQYLIGQGVQSVRIETLGPASRIRLPTTAPMPAVPKPSR